MGKERDGQNGEFCRREKRKDLVLVWMWVRVRGQGGQCQDDP